MPLGSWGLCAQRSSPSCCGPEPLGRGVDSWPKPLGRHHPVLAPQLQIQGESQARPPVGGARPSSRSPASPAAQTPPLTQLWRCCQGNGREATGGEATQGPVGHPHQLTRPMLTRPSPGLPSWCRSLSLRPKRSVWGKLQTQAKPAARHLVEPAGGPLSLLLWTRPQPATLLPTGSGFSPLPAPGLLKRAIHTFPWVPGHHSLLPAWPGSPHPLLTLPRVPAPGALAGGILLHWARST